MGSRAASPPDWRDRAKLLQPALLGRPAVAEHDPLFWRSPDPVAWCIRRGLVADPTQFYTQLAKIYRLRYSAEIPWILNPQLSPLPTLTIEEMAQQLVVSFTEDGQSWLAVANPCLEKAVMERLLQQVGTGTKVVIVPHGVIKDALTYVNASLSAPAVESGLAYAHPEHSSKLLLRRKLALMVGGGSLLLLLSLLFWRQPTVFFFYTALNFYYFLMNPFRLYMHIAGRHVAPTVQVSNEEARETSDDQLPYYTILVPLKEEAGVVNVLLNRLQSLEYPLEKLDIKIAVEVTDSTTLATLAKRQISCEYSHLARPENIVFHLVKVPTGNISTKPRSCNFALKLARGVVTVIYDAEDDPDPLQLKKAWHVLINSKLNTLCVQARLNFYNTKQNLLTRFFTLEYGFWFNSFLPGLQAMRIPIPLGGTSNHFLTSTLRRVGAWDPYNVTEDADLGWRLFRYKYATLVMNSYTYEEAMSQVWGWIKQRTRWQKGFIITFFVHTQNIWHLFRELGLWGGFSSLLMFSSVILLPLVNILLWILFLSWYLFPVFGLPRADLGLGPWAEPIGVTNLLFGNLLYVVLHMITAFRIGRKELAPLALFMPLYWPLMSLATYRAVWQILFQPSKWEKSAHGLVKS